jgi:hypothetical protein
MKTKILITFNDKLGSITNANSVNTSGTKASGVIGLCDYNNSHDTQYFIARYICHAFDVEFKYYKYVLDIVSKLFEFKKIKSNEDEYINLNVFTAPIYFLNHINEIKLLKD